MEYEEISIDEAIKRGYMKDAGLVVRIKTAPMFYTVSIALDWKPTPNKVSALPAPLAGYIIDLQDALRELVECKKLADQFDQLKQTAENLADAVVLYGTQAEYQRRKPAAWARAFELINGERV